MVLLCGKHLEKCDKASLLWLFHGCSPEMWNNTKKKADRITFKVPNLVKIFQSFPPYF